MNADRGRPTDARARPFTVEELRPLAILEGLPDRALEWFCEHGERIELDTGERMFERGDPADSLWVVVKGLIQGFEEVGGQWLLVASTAQGQVTGMLPFSRMTHYPRYTVAGEPSEVLRLDASLFKELLDISHEIGRRLVAQMSDRVRGDVRLEQQSEKMMALGRLSAGLAHELNNPAAAVRRASARLRENRARLPGLVTALVRHHVGDEGLQTLELLRKRGRQDEASSTRASTSGTAALEQSEKEDELSDWLEDHGIAESWEVAAIFVDAGLSVSDLEELAGQVPSEALPDAVAWLGGGIESDRILEEIDGAAGRITELVASIKIYSHMDESPVHKPTDVREGLDNTVTMLGHKLKKKSIRLERDYEENLPKIPANAGELNQVWTNLIDNAIDAVADGGNLALKVKVNGPWMEVEVEDDGPGIPEEMRSRIFEPFFTTKEVGVGTGLGLGIALRIVRTHQGDIEVHSTPGHTSVCVRLPVNPASPAFG